jgi:hypothetical protein
MLKRYLLLRTSENAVNAKFAEFPFYALGCIEPPGETSKTPIDNMRWEAYMEE